MLGLLHVSSSAASAFQIEIGEGSFAGQTNVLSDVTGFHISIEVLAAGGRDGPR